MSIPDTVHSSVLKSATRRESIGETHQALSVENVTFLSKAPKKQIDCDEGPTFKKIFNLTWSNYFYEIHTRLNGGAIIIKVSKCLSLISIVNVNLHQIIHGLALVHGLYLV